MPVQSFVALDGDKARPAPKGAPDQAYRISLPHEDREAFLLGATRRIVFRFDGSRAWKFLASSRRAVDDGPTRLVITLRGESGLLRRMDEGLVSADAWNNISLDSPAGNGPVTLSVENLPVSGYPKAPIILANPELLFDGPQSDKPTILLISIDTMRRDHLSCYGYSRATSPALENWASNQAVIFDQDISAASWTLPSHVSLLTGLDAAHHGINHDVGGNRGKTGAHHVNTLNFMAEILRRHGWTTAAWTGGAYLDAKFGFSQGFQRYSSWPNRAHDHQELSTHLKAALDYLRVHRRSANFVFLHTYAVHDPYRAWPDAWKELFDSAPPVGRFALHSPKNKVETGFRQRNELRFRGPNAPGRSLQRGELDRAIRMYDSGIRHVDDLLGSFFDTLKGEGLDRNLLVILTSDHGESFGEGNRWGHIDLSDEVLRVPLLISFPDGLGAGKRVASQISSTDILPTLLDYLGLDGGDSADGRSFLPLVAGDGGRPHDPVFSLSEAANRGLSMRFEDGRKIVFDTTAWFDPSPQLLLYRLHEDPTETRPIRRNIPQDLIDRSLRYLEEKASGLRLEILNHSQQAFCGTLEGAMIRPVGTKLLRPGKARLQFKKIGKAGFQLEPQQDLYLSFEKVFGNHLSIKAAVQGKVILDRSFDIRKGPVELGFDGEAWNRNPQESISIRLRWHGGERTLGEHPLKHEAELRNQLKALGYIEGN